MHLACSECQPHQSVPSSRCPLRRPRLHRLSWQIPTVDHYSVQCAKRVKIIVFHPCEKGRRDTAWISPRRPWRRARRRHGRPVARWKRDKFKFPPYHYLRLNGLTETWRCTDADEKERLLGFRLDHSRQLQARLRKFGSWRTPSCVSQAPQSTQVQVGSHCFSTKCWRLISPLSRVTMISRWHQTRSSRTQESTSRSTLRPAWWKWRKLVPSAAMDSSRSFVSSTP